MEENKYLISELISKENLEKLLKVIERDYPTLDTNSYRKRRRHKSRIKRLNMTIKQFKKLMELKPGYEKKWLQK